MLALNSELEIFLCEERYAFRVSNEAADVWHVMAKDTRNLKKRISTASMLGLAEPLQQFLAHVVLEVQDEHVVLQNVLDDNSDHRGSGTNEVDGSDAVQFDTQHDGDTLESEDIAGLFDADFDDIEDPNIVMIVDDDDDGGRPADVLELEPEIKPAVEFVSQVCRCPECVAKAKPPIPVPDQGNGSQRRQTLATVKGRVRLHSKTTVPSTKPKKREQNKLRMHAGPIAHPIKLVHRKMSTRNGKQETYLLGGGTHVASMSIRTKLSYLNAMQELKTLIEKMGITTVTMARQWVASQAHG